MSLFEFILTLTKIAAGVALLIFAPHVDHSIAGMLLGAGAAIGAGGIRRRNGRGSSGFGPSREARKSEAPKPKEDETPVKPVARSIWAQCVGSAISRPYRTRGPLLILLAITLGACGGNALQKAKATLGAIDTAAAHAQRVAEKGCAPVVTYCKLIKPAELRGKPWTCPALAKCHAAEPKVLGALHALNAALSVAYGALAAADTGQLLPAVTAALGALDDVRRAIEAFRGVTNVGTAGGAGAQPVDRGGGSGAGEQPEPERRGPPPDPDQDRGNPGTPTTTSRPASPTC